MVFETRKENKKKNTRLKDDTNFHANIRTAFIHLNL